MSDYARNLPSKYCPHGKQLDEPCLACEKVETAHEKLRAENARLRQILVDTCNATRGECTADVSVDFLAHLPSEVAMTVAENFRLAAELAALTPGGSEFHNSPDNCIQWIRERLESRAKVAKERNQLRKKLAAAEKIFNHFTFDHLMKMENGEGKTPANLVQEYLEP